MELATAPLALPLEQTYAELPGLSERWRGAEVPAPALLVLNEELAAELGLDPAALQTPEGVRLLAGSGVPGHAQAYSGHQFGGFSPRLGDGRALLLGELVDGAGRRRDLHLKGSGRTTFARGADGRAAVGPMLREYVVGEAMHALGIPTTRALSVAATGEQVVRETLLPGAVLCRVAASHLRVGTFQYAAAHLGPEHVQRLADHAIARHHPELAERPDRYRALFAAVLEAQAALVARWMLVGFVHGVMNTDNMTISGETIDYGPCAFMEAFDPSTVFSSIDHGGRYAYGHQPQIAQWNLARLAETLLPLIDEDTDDAVAAVTEILQTFPGRFHEHWSAGMAAKLGLPAERVDDELVSELLALLHAQRVDHTIFFRALSAGGARDLFVDRAPFEAWEEGWRALGPAVEEMDTVNPRYIPRNHKVEEALAAATAGDLAPFRRLVEVVTRPFEERPGLEAYAEPDPAAAPYRTYCGT